MINFKKERKEKMKVLDHMPKSRYTKLWFYLGISVYCVIEKCFLQWASQTSLKTSFLSIHPGGQLTLSGVKVGFLCPQMSLKESEDENRVCYGLLKHRDVSACNKAVPVTTIATFFSLQYFK